MTEPDREALEIIEAVAEPAESVAEVPPKARAGAALSEAGQMNVDAPIPDKAPDKAPDGDAAASEAANDDAPADADEAAAPGDGEKDGIIIMPLIPDDPGVDETEEPEPRRFKLF